MIDIQSRKSALADSWRTGASAPVGLYGELPPLSAHRPARTNPAPQPPRHGTTVR